MFSVICAWGQPPDPHTYIPRDYSVVPPSPEVSALMKYTETPVSCFSGTPSISLPIYSVRQGDLTVPITLNYHGGIRVDELEGNAGIGWTLSAGGCVSRTVNGLPDDISNTHSNARGLLSLNSTDKSLRSRIMAKRADYDIQDHNHYVSDLSWIATMGVDYIRGIIDMANDIFSVNGLGLSGIFAYNDSKSIVFQGDTNIKIEPNYVTAAYPLQFVITDKSGTEYYFSRREMTKYEFKYGYANNPQQDDSTYYASAWHITKIKSISNDSILFNYATKHKKLQRPSLNQSISLCSTPSISNRISSNLVTGGPGVTYYPEALTSIVSNSAIVEFEYTSGNDYPYVSVPDQVRRIIVRSNSSPSDTIHDIALNYQRFELSPNSDVSHLFLTSVVENGKTIFRLGYYLGDENVEYSYYESQDFGGYFNARPNNDLIPDIGGGFTSGNADRSVNPETAHLGALKSITYPTDGETRFRWETHDYSYLGSTDISEIPTLSPDYTLSVQTDTLSALSPPNFNRLSIKNFVVNSNMAVMLDLTRYFNFNPDILWGSEYYWDHESMIQPQYPRVVFTKEGQGQNIETHTYYIDDKTISQQHGNKSFETFLSPGTYTIALLDSTNVYGAQTDIEARFLNPDTDCGKVFISRVTRNNTGGQGTATKKFWPGLRIAAISSIADEQSDTIVKEYYYTNNDPTTTSTGVITSLPDYKSYYYFCTWNPEVPGIEGGDVVTAHSNGLRRSTTGQQTVEYPLVYEQYRIKNQIDVSGGTSPHCIEYRYSAQDSYFNQDYNGTQFLDYQPTGAQMWTSKSHWRGNLLQKTYRLERGAKGVRTKYEYNIFERPTEQLDTFTTDLFRIADFATAPMGLQGYAYDYSIGTYTLIPYTKTVRREITDEGDISYHHEMTDTVSYSYFYDTYTDNLDYDLVRSKEFKDSEGRAVTTYYTYRQVGNVYVNQPTTEVSVIDGIIVAAKRMEYGANNKLAATYTLSATGAPAANYQLGSKGLSPGLASLINEPEFTYAYDTNGLLSEIRYRGEVLASYLWGYKGLYPIVEAEGVPYQTLASAATSNGLSPQNLWWISSSTSLNALYSALRSSSTLAGKNITTMTYHWLIGVSEATDSRGVTTKFTYDDFGRLSSARDYNDYFIAKYVYKYKTEP